jgi:hypothetical protein
MAKETPSLSSQLLHDSYKSFFTYRKSVNDIDYSRRYSSWDVCYKYFRDVKSFDKNSNIAGFHLGFYLASWGMFRGSSELLNSGIEKYNNLAQILIDNKQESFIKQYKEIEKFLKGNNISATQTLITKIMLGAYSNTPAVDQFFNKTTKRYCKSGIYDKDQASKVFDKIKEIFNTEIDSGKTIEKFIEEDLPKSDLSNYKILDAIFFEIGRKLNSDEN